MVQGEGHRLRQRGETEARSGAHHYLRAPDGRGQASACRLEGRVTPHTLRHTFATRLLRATGNLEIVRKALGHASVATTADTYAHLVQDDVDRGIRSLSPGDGMTDELTAILSNLSVEKRKALVRALGKRSKKKG